MILLTIILTLSVPTEIDSTDNHRIADAISQIESGNNQRATGDRRKAIGAYQMHYAAWCDANRFLKSKGLLRHSWSSRLNPEVQDLMALAYIQWIKDTFYCNYNRQPTASEVYFAYSMGFSKSKYIGFDSNRIPSFKKDAIERFTTIYDHNQ